MYTRITLCRTEQLATRQAENDRLTHIIETIEREHRRTSKELEQTTQERNVLLQELHNLRTELNRMSVFFVLCTVIVTLEGGFESCKTVKFLWN